MKKHISVETTNHKRLDLAHEAWFTFKMDESDWGIQWKPTPQVVKEYIFLLTGWDYQKEKDDPTREILHSYLDTFEEVDPKEEGAVTWHIVIIEPDTN